MKTEYIIGGIFTGLALTAYFKRETIIATGADIMTKLSRSQFIEKYAPFSRVAAVGTGLFPSVFMAQAILESNNGNSSLTKEANNFFGIKASTGWKGETITKRTREVVNGQEIYVDAKFRKYPNALSSFLDRANFLIVNSRYKNAGVFTAKTPEAQADALQKAGYATDPNYANLLKSLITANNLKKYDS